MKTLITDYFFGRSWPLIKLIFSLLIIFQYQPVLAASLTDSANPVPAAALKVIDFCANPKIGLDGNAVATLVDYVLEPKSNKEAALPKIKETPGAYYEFDTRIKFLNFLQYSYSNQVPASFTSPASLRYSIWTGLPGELQKMPTIWKSVTPAGKPLIIHGLQHDCITPDLNTGVYYEYDLRKTLIHLNYKGRQVFISISKQIDISEIGKKGVILGNDEDWNYFYSGLPGATKAGLGWTKSYIYDFFAVGVYVESGSSPYMLRSGVFQWLRAGWSGINLVQSSHIINGMKRNAKNTKTILESPRLPAVSQIASTYQKISSLPQNELVDKYTTLQQARKSLAIQTGKININELKKQDSYATVPKVQIVEELMLEYFKITMGKSSLLGKNVVSVN